MPNVSAANSLKPIEDRKDATEQNSGRRLPAEHEDYLIPERVASGSLAVADKRRWRVRGYDAGQVLLLADQDLLPVVSEQGDPDSCD
jgi:hypothetical protein